MIANALSLYTESHAAAHGFFDRKSKSLDWSDLLRSYYLAAKVCHHLGNFIQKKK